MSNTEPQPSRKILLINGPNLNLLGTREPQIYGSTTLSQITDSVVQRGQELNITIVPFQSNHEGIIVDFLHSNFTPSARTKTAVILNPAAYTHTSVAIRDALLATNFPFVEVHISNIHAREPWRNHSYFSDKATGIIMGLGTFGYMAALEFWAQKWDAEAQ
ncbi:3-dehydroquinate dehydratase, type II [Rhinocladiella mackenziei CBS 650.93]|uniref:Catabolic 3-dehydroquinase n=1 Tax=Rhinocladiella mackenziei CBS 650.93 TaxID=1442369 RepID=A0A0D2FJI1_9EURO|nr:3-dehydroquinate dehydratase, type II [Rhinocladiella mackenziei CBS 650.93]KIX02092.1 3-dehydroquinate dehydratase, type II [Rhinocladiella mackenziei CBS 650.93]